MKSLKGLLVVATIVLSLTTQTQAAEQNKPLEGPSTFREHKGQLYRVLDKTSYKVVDTAGFFIYSYKKLVQGEKIARPQTVYYFSTSAHSPMIPLTVSNLETAFADNREFCYMLHSDFRSDKDLVSFIPSLNTYKIKYAYGKSVK